MHERGRFVATSVRKTLHVQMTANGESMLQLRRLVYMRLAVDSCERKMVNESQGDNNASLNELKKKTQPRLAYKVKGQTQ